MKPLDTPESVNASVEFWRKELARVCGIPEEYMFGSKKKGLRARQAADRARRIYSALFGKRKKK
jgi:hypothetical protein